VGGTAEHQSIMLTELPEQQELTGVNRATEHRDHGEMTEHQSSRSIKHRARATKS
jgi:hypothetical protein